MKKIITLFLSFFIFIYAYSQDLGIEKEIRQMEKERIAAILERDTAKLSHIWGVEYFANRPAGFISPRNKVLELIRKDTLSLESYKSEIEQIILRNGFVITMGSETVMPSRNNPNAGKLLNRRFTHVWSSEDGKWRLIARHANILCK